MSDHSKSGSSAECYLLMVTSGHPVKAGEMAFQPFPRDQSDGPSPRLFSRPWGRPAFTTSDASPSIRRKGSGKSQPNPSPIATTPAIYEKTRSVLKVFGADRASD